jgi:hypothetical protein
MWCDLIELYYGFGVIQVNKNMQFWHVTIESKYEKVL